MEEICLQSAISTPSEHRQNAVGGTEPKKQCWRASIRKATI
jgi:hypothetical protein